ncbi:hypothetical protein FCF25_02195 [Haloprofundus sp. MHR1]|nr:hypothetical protein FCF25_02195 [Haloprofundus sp. MHR1]
MYEATDEASDASGVSAARRTDPIAYPMSSFVKTVLATTKRAITVPSTPPMTPNRARTRQTALTARTRDWEERNPRELNNCVSDEVLINSGLLLRTVNPAETAVGGFESLTAGQTAGHVVQPRTQKLRRVE